MLVGEEYLIQVYGQPVAPPVDQGELEALFVGGFPEYRKDPHVKGRVILSREWINENLVTEWFPLLGMRTVHREMVVPLYRAMAKIAASPLSDYIKPNQCGTFLARFKTWNPRRTLSLHSVGLALDLNWNDNPYGQAGNIPPWIVKTMEDEGFTWGGTWDPCDDMHFQRAYSRAMIPKTMEVK